MTDPDAPSPEPPDLPTGPPGDDAPRPVDWFGHPIRPDGGRRVEPVPCPACGEQFDRAAALDAHLRAEHAIVAHGRPLPTVLPRFVAWVRGLKFLPLWYVLLMNVLFTSIIYLAWGNDLQLYSFGDQSAVAKTWVLRLSLLPTALVLVWRTIDRVE
jgi:hypothetical protein